MIQPFLQLKNVAKQFGSITAVADVKLDIGKGEFITFLGPSGSGKSTTLYMIAGLEQPSGGEIVVNGANVSPTPPNKRNMGMVFQRYTLFPHLSVAENIAFPLKVRGQPHSLISDRVKEMLRLVRLQGFEDRKPSALSGGQQQRVAFARALSYSPSLLLMDEPLSALDKKLREEMQFEIKRIHYETGVTIIYVTHDQEEALRLSDRIAVFSQGRIDQVGAGIDLHESPATRFVAQFIGDSNFVNCEIVRTDGKTATVSFGPNIIVSGLEIHDGRIPGVEPAVMIRPERLSLSTATTDEEVSIPAKVTLVTFLGNNYQISAEVGKKPISIRIPVGHGAGSFAVGEPVFLNFSRNHAKVFL